LLAYCANYRASDALTFSPLAHTELSEKASIPGARGPVSGHARHVASLVVAASSPASQWGLAHDARLGRGRGQGRRVRWGRTWCRRRDNGAIPGQISRRFPGQRHIQRRSARGRALGLGCRRRCMARWRPGWRRRPAGCSRRVGPLGCGSTWAARWFGDGLIVLGGVRNGITTRWFAVFLERVDHLNMGSGGVGEAPRFVRDKLNVKLLPEWLIWARLGGRRG